MRTIFGVLLSLILVTPIAPEKLPEYQVAQLIDCHSYLKDPRSNYIADALEIYNVDPARLVSPILSAAIRYDLDPLLIVVVLKQESDFRTDVRSHKGAIGIAQIMPFWARERGFEPKKLFNLHTNIDTCGYVLRHYLDKYKGNKFKAVRAYFGRCDAGTVYATKIFKKYDNMIERL